MDHEARELDEIEQGHRSGEKGRLREEGGHRGRDHALGRRPLERLLRLPALLLRLPRALIGEAGPPTEPVAWIPKSLANGSVVDATTVR